MSAARFRLLVTVPFTLGAFLSWMARQLPDQWNNVTAIARSRSPLLVVHSDADQVNPLWMGERVYSAAAQPKQIVILHGLSA